MWLYIAVHIITNSSLLPESHRKFAAALSAGTPEEMRESAANPRSTMAMTSYVQMTDVLTIVMRSEAIALTSPWMS